MTKSRSTRSITQAALCIAGLSLAGCVTAVSNPQSPTATEQLLTRHAARRAAAEANLVCRRSADHCVAVGAKVFVQVRAGDDTPAGRFAVAAFDAHLAGSGAALVDERAQAEVVVDLSIAAAAIDDQDRIFGVPSVNLPAIPGHTSTTTATPEISFYATHERTGVVELDAIARDAKTGRMITAVGPLSASAHLVRGSILTGISFGRTRELPEIRADQR